MHAYAIQSVKEPTKFLPGYEGRGHTWREPKHWWVINPRLFMSRNCAARALGFWLKGRWSRRVITDFETGYKDKLGLVPIPAPERRREDFEIVKVQLSIVPPTS
jgi:hypothetical protein